MSLSPRTKKRLIVGGTVIAVLVAFAAIVGWYKFFREVDDGPWKTDAERFMYGSIGAESKAGLPYWIWVCLPRVFPDLLPPGGEGYHAFGIPWEEGHEMPTGFTKKIVGFPRVANNCAICHTATYRTKAGQKPIIVPAGPNHTANIQAVLNFLTNCGNDPRFNADTLLPVIEQHTKFSWLDRLAWRYVVIPQTQKALAAREPQFAWMNRPHWPQWGLGRDDPMNLTKYFMTNLPVDNTVGQADFPSVWNMGLRQVPELGRRDALATLGDYRFRAGPAGGPENGDAVRGLD